jgi:hypothetical protein
MKDKIYSFIEDHPFSGILIAFVAILLLREILEFILL